MDTELIILQNSLGTRGKTMNSSNTFEKSKSVNEHTSSVTIEAKAKWLSLDLSEIWKYRDLILLLVKRDFVAIYKQTILGPAWFIVQPLLSTLIYTVVFGNIARIPTDGIPPLLFYLSGIIVWNLFASCVTKTADTFIANAGIFGKVYFPRLSVPIAIIITNAITFAIQFAVLLLFLLFFYLRGAPVIISGWIALAPLAIILLAAFGMGFGIIISSVTTRYRDLSFLVGFGMQLWMYATPVVYPMSRVPEHWRWVFVINPVAIITECFRYMVLGVGTFDGLTLFFDLIIGFLVFFVGIILFHRMERTFIDVI